MSIQKLFGGERREQLKILKTSAPTVFADFISIKVRNIENTLSELRYSYQIEQDAGEKLKIAKQGKEKKEELDFYKSI